MSVAYRFNSNVKSVDRDLGNEKKLEPYDLDNQSLRSNVVYVT